jgi:hypothetical protein
MAFTLVAAAVALLLLAGMLASLWGGRRLALRGPAPTAGSGDSSTLDAAVFGLFGLLLAFTFSGASARFEARRALVVQEANAIGTAWLRLDLLPAAAQQELRPLFRRYVEARLSATSRPPGGAEARAELARGAALQAEIWARATAAARADGNPGVISLTAQALNEMIDLTTTRAAAAEQHPPAVVFLLLFAFGLAASFVAGHASARHERLDWAHALVFAGAIAAAVYVILDLEYPRLGLIRVDAIDQLLVDLLEGMR